MFQEVVQNDVISGKRKYLWNDPREFCEDVFGGAQRGVVKAYSKEHEEVHGSKVG